jgi:hypothetical protein
MPRRVFRVIRCVCGEDVTVLLRGLDPAQCQECGALYDPRTGELLPVCEGFEIPGIK